MFPFEVDPTSDLPLWVQLRNRIAYLINDGTLAPGDKLPTVRGLASEISINYNTVNKAYLSLVSDRVPGIDAGSWRVRDRFGCEDGCGRGG